ncbi:hypothetical protein [Stutzerimonas stutzeri]|uniref:Uncharacterized protein n=1 Tax=Stutzerimonas stutzeri (strain A1501) TaxID=379731 RepID=A4VQ31_STUS1|nr:hypothetical protein [Stutzerimonas stutzeri]ABP81082.1 conserved hypothetical protein [Stutzerimonas stutzeri A1501]RRV84496.1 hypothetical protein EGI92_03550 [Stutzerimonas stutzeri]RRW49154.1 hypothetical protein EGJ42_12970 [Stutzerimonas stutzeri]UWG59851.1 hypothetical protein NDR94_17550 [Stutzerimonas stutzeri]
MSQSESDRLVYWPRISVMDFLTFTESMQTSFSPDYPLSGLGLSDLNFVINAPFDYYPPTNGALATLYFDQTDCSRALPEDAYQIKCSHHLNTHEFMKWAEQGIHMLTHPFMHVGIIGIDIMDLINILRACESQKLLLEIIPYDDTLEVPWEQLQRFRFRNLFASLLAGHDLTMQMYSDLGNALEHISPNVDCMKLAANCDVRNPPALMLLGELEP